MFTFYFALKIHYTTFRGFSGASSGPSDGARFGIFKSTPPNG